MEHQKVSKQEAHRNVETIPEREIFAYTTEAEGTNASYQNYHMLPHSEL